MVAAALGGAVQSAQALQPIGVPIRVDVGPRHPGQRPGIALAPDGSFVVVWTNGLEILVRRFGTDGNALSDPVLVSDSTTGPRYYPALAMDRDGDFVVVWQDGGTEPAGFEIRGRRFSADGVAQGETFGLGGGTKMNSRLPDVAMDDDGDFVVAWEQEGRRVDTGFALPGCYYGNGPCIGLPGLEWQRYSIRAQRYDADGERRGLPVTADSVFGYKYTQSAQSPAVAMAADGSFAIAWTIVNGSSLSAKSAYAQRFDANAYRQGDRITLLDGNAGESLSAVTQDEGLAIAGTATGNFVVAGKQWPAPAGIRTAQYAAGGGLVSSFVLAPSNAYATFDNPRVTLDEQGRVLMSWQRRTDQETEAVSLHVQRFDAGGAPLSPLIKVGTVAGDRAISDIDASVDGHAAVIAWIAGSAGNEKLYVQRFGE